MQKKGNIIVLAGTKWQIPLIKKIKSKGYGAIVFNLYENSPAFQYADDYRIVDILDVEKCYQLSSEFSPIAVMSEECDIATTTVALLSERLGLKSIGADQADLYTNKYKMRVFSKLNGLDTPVFCKCYTVDEALKFFGFAHKKMIMKPLDSNSSRGIYTINNSEDILTNFEHSLRYSRVEPCVLLEEYIDGTEFTVDGIVTEKGHISLAVSEKKHYKYNENIACSLYFSHENPNYDYEELKKLNDSFVNLSGLPFGLTHAEYKYRDGKFYLIEIGARGGGNLISAMIVPAVTGVDNYQYLLEAVLGEHHSKEIEIDDTYKSRYAVLHFFDIDKEEGVVKQICGEKSLSDNERVLDYCLYCKEGDTVCKASDDSKRIGYYIAYGESREELDSLIEKIDCSFKISLEET